MWSLILNNRGLFGFCPEGKRIFIKIQRKIGGNSNEFNRGEYTKNAKVEQEIEKDETELSITNIDFSKFFIWLWITNA